MSDWSDLDLPIAERGGYSIFVDQGLLRTPFKTAKPRQTRRWSSTRHTFSLTFLLTQAELQAARAFLDTDGYTWFTIDLLSSYGDVVPHNARLIEDYNVTTVGSDTHKLTYTVEAFFLPTTPPTA